MKKIYRLMTLLLCCAGAFTVVSCSDDDETGRTFPLIESPIESVTAVDGNSTATAVISDADKTIKIQLRETTDISALKITVKVAQGALLKTPSTPTATVNLEKPLDDEKPYSIVVHNGKTEIAYKLIAMLPVPIIDAKVGGEKAVIEDNTITIAYKTGMNINAMAFDFTLEPGAVITSPENKTFDLEFEAGTLNIEYKNKEYTYAVKQQGYVDPLLNGGGWTDVTADYGTLPAYIKVYKNENLLKDEATKSIGYIAIMGAQATMNALGDGSAAMKTIYTLADANPTWNVLLTGNNGAPAQTILRSGAFIQNPDAVNSYGTIGQGKDGKNKIAWAMKFDNTLYSFPFREGTSYTQRVKADGAVWDAKTAISGIPMILWDGNVLTEAQTVCNDGNNNGLYVGAPRYARSAVGVTASGKVIAFCGQQVEGSVGLSMLELAQVLKDCGCVSAINFEGSGTPNMLVNKLETVKNSKVYDASGALLGKDKAKAVQVAVAFK